MVVVVGGWTGPSSTLRSTMELTQRNLILTRPGYLHYSFLDLPFNLG